MLQKKFTNSATVTKMFKAHAVAAVNLVIWRLHAGVRIRTVKTVEKQAMWSAHAEIKRAKRKAQRLKTKKDSAKYKKKRHENVNVERRGTVILQKRKCLLQ